MGKSNLQAREVAQHPEVKHLTSGKYFPNFTSKLDISRRIQKFMAAKPAEN